MEGMLSAKDYADARDVHPDTVRKWCVRGNLPGVVKIEGVRNGAGGPVLDPGGCGADQAEA